VLAGAGGVGIPLGVASAGRVAGGAGYNAAAVRPPPASWALLLVAPLALLLANALAAWPGHRAAGCASATSCGRSER